MAVFTQSFTSFGYDAYCFSTSYVKQKHDLYTWNYSEWPDGEPIFGGLDLPGRYSGYYPNGYNQTGFWNENLNFNLDFSGKASRPRRFGATHQGAYHNFGLVGCPWADAIRNQDYDNIPPEYIPLIQNIGFWNYGLPTGILISPRHALLCGHCYGGQSWTFVFTLKNNQVIEVIGDRVKRSDGNELILGDTSTFRLREDLSQYVNAGLLTYYNDYVDLEDQQNFDDYNQTYSTSLLEKEDAPISWVIDGGDRVYRQASFFIANSDIYDQIYYDWSSVPLPKKYHPNEVGNVQVFVGDSGSPTFVYDKNSQKVIFVTNQYGGGSNHVYENAFLSSNRSNLEAELNSFGYFLNPLRISDLSLAKVKELQPYSVQETIESSIITINTSTPINNYSHIGFLPGNSLQSSELNEIQERFYLDQTLYNSFLFNWLIFSDNDSLITGKTDDKYLYSASCLPINPNLVEASYESNSLTIVVNPGWYKVNSPVTNNMSVWLYLTQGKSATVDSPSTGIYTICLDLEHEEILCSNNIEDEGYEFNSNVGGYIEPWVPGSNRLKLSLKDLIVKLPNQQRPEDLPLVKIRTGIDNIANGRFLVQYMNNYKIDDINIL